MRFWECVRLIQRHLIIDLHKRGCKGGDALVALVRQGAAPSTTPTHTPPLTLYAPSVWLLIVPLLFLLVLLQVSVLCCFMGLLSLNVPDLSLSLTGMALFCKIVIRL